MASPVHQPSGYLTLRPPQQQQQQTSDKQSSSMLLRSSYKHGDWLTWSWCGVPQEEHPESRLDWLLRAGKDLDFKQYSGYSVKNLSYPPAEHRHTDQSHPISFTAASGDDDWSERASSLRNRADNHGGLHLIWKHPSIFLLGTTRINQFKLEHVGLEKPLDGHTLTHSMRFKAECCCDRHTHTHS